MLASDIVPNYVDSLSINKKGLMFVEPLALLSSVLFSF